MQNHTGEPRTGCMSKPGQCSTPDEASPVPNREKGSPPLTWQCSSEYSQATVAYLLRVNSALSSRSLMKKLDSIDPWGSCFQLDFDQLITTLWAWLFSQFSLDLTVYFGIGEELDKGLLAHVTSELKVFRSKNIFLFFREGSFFNKMTSPEGYKNNK